jgi:hypothetical protein
MPPGLASQAAPLRLITMYNFDEAASSGNLSDFELNLDYQCWCERNYLLKALQRARLQFQLAANTIDAIGNGLKIGLTDTDAAMEWLADEGLIDFVDLEPAPAPKQEAAQ